MGSGGKKKPRRTAIRKVRAGPRQPVAKKTAAKTSSPAVEKSPEKEDEEEWSFGTEAEVVPAENLSPPAEEIPKTLSPPISGMTRKQLAEKYMPFVRSVAGKIKKTLAKNIEFDDLVSYGMLGLFEAADRFDPKQGANFMTFAYYRVRGAIFDGLRSMGWVSRSEYQKVKFEERANAYLSNLNDQHLTAPRGASPLAHEETEALASVVENLVTVFVTALDAMEGFQVEDESPLQDEALEVKEAKKLIAEALSRLPEQERQLLELYYYREMSLQDVGKTLGLSKSWTSRLHTRAIEKLGRLLRNMASDFAEDATPPDDGGKSKQQTGPPRR